MAIGDSWYASSAQRTAINTECRRLLLTHVFEVFERNAVEFRTDWFNRKSQARLNDSGAKRDGV
ncbi:hypothetical protein [Undibacterium sp.]|uniref:hypothetical protein n=1 Tax=Undibacterium sp. TaxID=1914977 RepID=UPI00351D22AF